MQNKTFIIVTMVLLAVSLVSFLSYAPARYDSAHEAKIANFPKIIGPWQGEDMPLEERDYEILETKNLIVRGYKNSLTGDSVYLFMVYSGDNRKVMHPPEICYTGGGATIIDKSVIPVTDSIKANKFTIEDKNSRQLVVYWFRTVDLNTYNYFEQQLKIVLNRSIGKRASGALIRVSTLIKDNNPGAALSLIKSFCQHTEPLLTQYLP